MNENKFKHYGKVYVAKQVDNEDWTCNGCDLGDKHGCFAPDLVKCLNEDRTDNRNVIFVEKQP